MPKNQFAKNYKNTYYSHYNETAPIKKPKWYKRLLILALASAIGSLIFPILCVCTSLQNNYLLISEVVLYVFSIVIFAIADSKYTFKEYKKQLLEKSLKAIDNTFEDIWHPKNLYGKEKCIEIFQHEYSKSLEYWVTRIINKTVANILTVAFWLISFIYPSAYDKEFQPWFIIIVIGFLAVQYFGTSIPKMTDKIMVDYLYNRVCTDYKFYLAEKCVYAEMQNTPCQVDQKNTVDSNKNAVKIGGGLLVIGLVIFPMIVWGIGEYFNNTPLASTIITYVGSIIGGGITLVGVYITIVANNRQRREDLTFQYMPVLTERIVPYAEKTTLCSEITYLFGHPLFDDNDTEFCSQQIELENVGRGEIVNCSIDMMEVRLFTASEDSLFSIKNDAYILGDGFFQFIPINGKIVLYLAYPKVREWANERNASLSIETTIEIVIRGIIGEREYRYRLHYFLDLNYEKEDLCRSEIRTVTLSLLTDIQE